MNLFGRRQAPDALTANTLAKLESRVLALESAVRTLEAEQINMHDQVRKWMRRAVAAQKAAEQREAVEIPEIPAATPLRTARPWGARARIAARLSRPAPVPDVTLEDEGEGTNGVHP